MIRAWQEVRKGFRFIRPGFDQYGYLKAATDSLKREKNNLPVLRGRVDFSRPTISCCPVDCMGEFIH